MSIKLIYTDEKSGDTKRTLYASETGVPADTDEKVIYDPEFSIDENPFVYNMPDEDGAAGFAVGTSTRQIPSDEDTKVIASAYETNIVNGKPVSSPVPPVETYTLKRDLTSELFGKADITYNGETKSVFDVEYGQVILSMEEESAATITVDLVEGQTGTMAVDIKNEEGSSTKMVELTKTSESGTECSGTFTLTENSIIELTVTPLTNNTRQRRTASAHETADTTTE